MMKLRRILLFSIRQQQRFLSDGIVIRSSTLNQRLTKCLNSVAIGLVYIININVNQVNVFLLIGFVMVNGIVVMHPMNNESLLCKHLVHTIQNYSI